MKKYWLGLDIGGTKCAVLLAVLDRGIVILDKKRFATRTERGFRSTWEELCGQIDAILQENGLSRDEINAIGVSCGGPLDSRNGVVLCPPNLPGWVDIPLAQMLTERYGIPAYLQNDANACALTEWKLGAGRGTHDMIFLTMGTGMGAGVIAEDRLIRGVTDMGGEVGHLRLTEDGPVGFGKNGSFEGWCSGGGIARQARKMTEELLAAGKTPTWVRDGIAPEEITTALMADYAKKGDPDAKGLFEQVGTMLGRGIALLADAFNPERVVIGSIFVRCEALLRPAMEEALRREAIPFALEKLKVVPAETGEQIGDLASIMTALYATDTALPAPEEAPEKAAVTAHFEKLFARYPALEVCRGEILEVYRILKDCYRQKHKLLLCGNGGSCADCEHIAGELMKGFLLKRPLSQAMKDRIAAETDASLPAIADTLQQPLPAVVLTDHNALSTAFANDCDPDLVMAQQVLGFGQPGDVLLGISTSGNARNVACAVATAKAMGLRTVGLTGGSGGLLKARCDAAITVPAGTPAECQEYHLPVYHALCAMLEAEFFDE